MQIKTYYMNGDILPHIAMISSEMEGKNQINLGIFSFGRYLI